jgi:hypothetical protein
VAGEGGWVRFRLCAPPAAPDDGVGDLAA